MTKLTPYRQERADAGHCLSGGDGECNWTECPQLIEHKSTCPRHLADMARRDPDEDEGRAGG